MDEETLTPAEPHTTLDAVDLNSSCSDSDTDSDSDPGGEIETLEAELATNPANYDANVQYIKLTRKSAETEKLRRAREAMSELFPLTPSMWQEWAHDEAAMASGPDALAAVERLYERGLSDYLSVPLWLDYLSFVQEWDFGVSKCRDLFERALAAAGLHLSEGSKIWEAYREFEEGVLRTIDGSDTKAREAQIQRIRNVFQRQLSVPHVDMRSTLLAFKAWEIEQGTEGSIPETGSSVASAYQKALELYNARVRFEEQVTQPDMPAEDRLKQFMKYLKFEESIGDPARVQVLYERAITEYPVASQLWLDYTRYLEKTFKVGKIISNVYSRALKNCSWVGELWVRYLLSLERDHASEKEIAAVFYKSQQCTFSTLDEYADLFFTRIDGLRRKLSCPVEGDQPLDYSLLRATFQSASDYLLPNMTNSAGLIRLYVYWSRLELQLGKDIAAARGVWESLLKISGTMIEAWQGYISMEIEWGHVKEARSIYKRCFSKKFPGTGSEDICHLWLRFEREFGSLDDFDHAERKVVRRLQELQQFRSKQELKLTEERDSTLKKNVGDKRKLASEQTDEQPPRKRQKDAGQKKTKESNVRNLAKPDEGNEMKGLDVKGAQNEMEPAKEKTKVFTDRCTAFVSNLSLNANNEHIHQLFSDVGGVVAIRILKDKFTGKSRGLAYVDFSDDAHLTAALAKNKKTLLGKKLSIARSDPKRGKKEHVHTVQTGAASGSGETRQGSDNVLLKEKNTFAVPRNVAALGWNTNKPKTEDPADENPKSNDEFRNMFLKR